MAGHFRPSSLKISDAPRNVEQITRSSQEYNYDAEIPLRFWLRSATALLKEAEIYMREGDEQTTYLLLYRHAHLILTNLTAHPDAKNPATRPLLEQAKKDVGTNLRTLDALKPRINQRYENYAEQIRQLETRQAESRLSTHQNENEKPRTQIQQESTRRLQGHENRELAVEIAHRERRRRAAIQNADAGHSEKADYSQQVSSIQRLVEQNRSRDTRSYNLPTSPSTAYSYPHVRHSQQGWTANSQTAPTVQETVPLISSKIDLPPLRPAKVNQPNGHLVPLRPEKVVDLPQPKGSPSQASYTFAFSAYLEDGTPLRTLFLPPTLRTTFLRIAHRNTQANLETCAILAGTIISNALFVSKLIVPAQTATTDTCDMINESELFDYVDSEKDLIVLGWIHTHPTQTCFMSSRDLHTHASYQMMLAESIAIVCAPSKGDIVHGGDWGVYRLTDPPGKPIILKCTKPGTFHPHEESDDRIYLDARRPGHVVEASGLEFEVVDLRAHPT